MSENHSDKFHKKAADRLVANITFFLAAPFVLITKDTK